MTLDISMFVGENPIFSNFKTQKDRNGFMEINNGTEKLDWVNGNKFFFGFKDGKIKDLLKLESELEFTDKFQDDFVNN